jgi:hypothetical protein
MAEIGLQGAGIDALVGEAVAAGMPEHVGVDLEANLGFATENDRRAYVRSALCGNAPAHAENKKPQSRLRSRLGLKGLSLSYFDLG